MSGVSAQGLSVRFGTQTVISALDLQVDEGEFVVLLGPSGCGKSTLLHALAGLVEVSAGRVEIGGRDMTWAEPAERGIGMVFQSYALYPTMTVERNISFGLRMAGMARDEVRRRVQRAAQLLQLEPLLQRRPAQLSGGQRQRVAIGRALVREAGVTLFDEPLSNLDAQLRTELRRELKLLHQQLGSTMVYVTHDQVEAMTLATRVVVMRGGAIQQLGTPAEVYERPRNRFVAGFVGANGMNLVPGRLHIGDGGPRFVAPALDVSMAGYAFAAPLLAGEVVLGVRPEHLRLTAEGAMAGRVVLVEATGHQQLVWLRAAGAPAEAPTWSVLAPADVAVHVGECLRFDIECGNVSLFDGRSGLRL